jgi:hypothetical protein
MRTSLRFPLALGALLVAAGCSSGSGDGVTSFSTFVTGQIQTQTDDVAQPLDLAGRDFAFVEDPSAFDAVLPPDLGPTIGP